MNYDSFQFPDIISLYEGISISVEQKNIPTLNIEDKPLHELPTLTMDDPEGERPTRWRLEKILQIALLAAALVLLYFLVSSLYPDFVDLYRDRVKPFAVRYWPNAVAVVVLLVVGFNLYLFRGYKRTWFGIAEIAFGLGLGWYSVNKAAAGAVFDGIVIFFAALYILGRGFVNLSYSFQPIKINLKKKGA